MTPTTIGFVIGLLVALGFWQRAIDRRQTRQTIDDLEQAQATGTDRAVAQHPQIDVQTCIGCGTCVAACPEDGVLGLVNGTAHVIRGSRCIGHGRCEEVCPVGAIRVGLGDISDRADIPVLTEQYETSVPGIYVIGELGGIALIRNAIQQGTIAVEDIAAKLATGRREDGDQFADLLIVGAGPSGLAAALKAKEHGLRPLVIDQGDVGGTIRKYPRRKLTLTQPAQIPLFGPMDRSEYRKEELVEMWETIVTDFQLDVRRGVKFLGCEPTDGGFVSQTSAGRVASRTVVLALGRRGIPRKLSVPGEEQEKVLYQLVDAATYLRQHVLVVGGGDSAIEAATGLANQPGNVVTLSYRKPHFFRIKPRNAERIEEYAAAGRLRLLMASNVRAIHADSVDVEIAEHPEGADECVTHLETLQNDYTFILAGGEPPFPLLKQLGIRFGNETLAEALQ